MMRSKWEALLPNVRHLERGTDSNIEVLVLIDTTVVVVALIATIVIMMVEFCRGL